MKRRNCSREAPRLADRRRRRTADPEGADGIWVRGRHRALQLGLRSGREPAASEESRSSLPAQVSGCVSSRLNWLGEKVRFGPPTRGFSLPLAARGRPGPGPVPPGLTAAVTPSVISGKDGLALGCRPVLGALTARLPGLVVEGTLAGNRVLAEQRGFAPLGETVARYNLHPDFV